MFHTVTKIIKWFSIPAVLFLAAFSCLAGRYEGLMNLAICMAAILYLEREAWLKKYFCCAGLVVVVVIFSPLFFMTKVFLLMGFTGIAAVWAIFAVFRPQPLVAR